MKKVSIIIPCYNVEQYLDRCYQSLIHQTIGIEHLELIFINDASPDNGIQKLYQYESEYPDSIIIIDSDENLKQGGARNLGLLYASADYIGYMDPDDWAEPTMYEKLYSKAIEYNADLVSCKYGRVATEEDSLPIDKGRDSFYIVESIEARRSLIIKGFGNGGIVCKVIKRDLLFHNNISFPEHLSYEDNYFNDLLLMYVVRYYNLDETLYHYFNNSESTTQRNNSLQHFDRLKVSLMSFQELEKRGFFQDYYEEIEYNFINLYYINSIHLFFVRFPVLPIAMIRHIIATIRKLCPNYQHNPYNKYMTPFGNLLLSHLHEDMSDEFWLMLQNKYIKAINIYL